MDKKETVKRKLYYKQKRNTLNRRLNSSRQAETRNIKFDGKTINSSLAREILGKRPSSWANCSYFKDANKISLNRFDFPIQSNPEKIACIAIKEFNSRSEVLTEYIITDKKCTEANKKVCMGGYRVQTTAVSKIDNVGNSIYSLDVKSDLFVSGKSQTGRMVVHKLKRRIYASVDSQNHSVLYLDITDANEKSIYSTVQRLSQVNRAFISCGEVGDIVEATVEGMTVGTGAGITIGLTLAGGYEGGFIGALTGLGTGLALTDVVIFPIGFFIAEELNREIKDACNSHNPPPPPPTPPGGLRPEDISNIFDEGNWGCPHNLIPNICVNELPDTHSIADDGSFVTQDGGYETFRCCTVPSAE